MLSLQAIRDIQLEAAEKAARDHATPFVYWPGDPVEPHRLPFIGDYVPRGWRLVRTYLVDATGIGRDDEPAMTIRAWGDEVDRVRDEYAGQGKTPGWAIYEAGEFQVVVGLYERDYQRGA